MDKYRETWEKSKITVLKAVIGFLVLALVLFALKGELKNLNLIEALHILKQEKNSTILVVFIMGLIAVAVTTLYDLVLCKELNIDVNKKKIFKISWMSNTTNNFIGAGGVAGGGLRTAFYKKEGVSTKEAVNMTFTIWMTTLTGLSGLILLNFNFIVKLDNKFYVILAILISLYIPLYLSIDKIPYIRDKFKDSIAITMPLKSKVKMVLVAVLEWIVAGIFFAGLIHYFAPEASYFESLAVFSLAITIGVCSFIPGGIGSFDLACIYGFKLFNISSSGIIVGMLLFRIFYYLIPWLLSMFLIVGELLNAKRSKKNKNNLALINEFGIKALSGLIFFSGIVLILSSILPNFPTRVRIVRKFLSVPMLQFSEVTVIGIGFILIILSKGILDKVKGAYNVTIILLILGSLLSFIKGLNIEASSLLGVIAFLLYLSKDRFYRENSPLEIKNAILYTSIVLIMSLFYGFIYFVINNSLAFIPYKPVVKNFMYTPKMMTSYFLILLVIVLIIHFLAVKKIEFEYANDDELEKLKEFLKKYDGNCKTHLLFLKDKSLFYAADNKVIIGFRMYDNKMIALGDPIGDKTLFKKAIGEFRAFADKNNMTPVFYEINEENLPLYHENGYNFFKLGEEAFVKLEGFNLNGKKKADLRYIKNRIEKGLFEFEMINPPFNDELFNKLKEISDKWLGDRKEKGFSLGWFNKEYMSLTPIGVVKHEGEIIGFATLLPVYDDKTVGIDLMRLIPNPPNGTMDAVFYSFINWAINEGYEYFNLGMAPLSNVGVNKYSKVKERMGRYVFTYGNKVYSFKGLRKYKEKFDPIWCGRYLAYPANSNLPSIIVDLAKLVAEAPREE
ncbi:MULTISPECIES: bifunctional lysylphosphatidylglycerol flippase/synthetase MprF [Clostridium]|uniref:Phosphatidylglycerol lysyltransferase n=1 Tax=Clostridium senegalense TaxID=1465809 RepID=A0A6M0H0H2_9CLOT|nr:MULTISPECIES: bifunctional lysylphosphatidylglycerol flippase/synthetase MprF [Clostridium]NEU04255.1 bifunctional lysylphosphatidylglycerol flippase/synthetase MprF [Clostridium senegalense]